MPKVFICYRREDSAYPAHQIYTILTNHFGSESVVFDVDTIPLGIDFRKYLNKQVSRCDILIAVIGDKWMENLKQGLDKPNDFVRIEIQAALKREIPVVPVLVGNATMPDEENLPPELAGLAYMQAAEVRAGPDLKVHLERLINGLEYLLAELKAEEKAKEEERRQKKAEEAERKAEEERKRREAEEAERKANEERRRREAEEAERKAAEERKRKEAEEAKRKAEEERKRKEAEEERKRKEAEEAERKTEEDRKLKEEGAKRKTDELEHKAEEKQMHAEPSRAKSLETESIKPKSPEPSTSKRSLLIGGLAGLIIVFIAILWFQAQWQNGKGTSEFESKKDSSYMAAKQTTSKDEAVKATLERLFALCAVNNYDKAADYLVYRGPDKTRKWKDSLNPTNPEERKAAEGACRSIKSMLEDLGDFQYEKFFTQKQSEGEWLAWEGTFNKSGNKEKYLFAFLDIGGRYALGDID
jgi:flagellar biosynthesis GTPase FlhF